MALNFLFGLFLLFIGITNTYVSTPIFLSICGVIFLSAVFIGNKREDRVVLKQQRLELFKSNPKLGVGTNLLVLIMPISLGLISYFVFGLAGMNAFHLTIGGFCVGSFISHFLTAPHLAKLDLTTFD